MTPLPGSPALDRGIASEVDSDQQGLARVAGLAADADAVERRVDGSDQDDLPALTARLRGDPLVWEGDLESLSVRHAMALARPGGGVSLAAPVAGEEICFEEEVLLIPKEVEMAGPTDLPQTRLAPAKTELLESVERGDLILRWMELSGIRGLDSQGLIPVEVRGRLSLLECVAKDNELFAPLFLVNGTFESVEWHFFRSVGSFRPQFFY